MEKKSLSVGLCVVTIASVLLIATLPVACTTSTLELVGAVPPTDGISIILIDAMEILDSNPEELFFTTQNVGAYCGGGTPAAVWKMIIDQNTGKMVSVELIQLLSKIQQAQGDLFESPDGTLFTGGGWCGYKPAYYSTDAGETWQSADSGLVHPPNNVRSFVEFNGDVYAGTGYEPYHGEVYRWLGNGNWEKVLDTGIVRNIVDAMVVYDNKLFVGSEPYGYSGSACASTIPVLVSSDGNIFNPTTGMPGCHCVSKLLVVGNQLVAHVRDRNSGQWYIYHWNDIPETWEEVAAYNLGDTPNWCIASHNGVIYAYGQAPSDAAAGIYQSMDLGLTWQQIAVLENPDAISMTIHDGTLYIGTYSDADYKAYIYSWTPIEVPPVEDTEAYIEYVNETRQDLPDGIFNRPEEDVADVKNDFSDLFDDALENIDEEDYEGAIEKLNRVREKIFEEIVESADREEIICLIDDLIAYLETLL